MSSYLLWARVCEFGEVSSTQIRLNLPDSVAVGRETLIGVLPIESLARAILLQIIIFRLPRPRSILEYPLASARQS